MTNKLDHIYNILSDKFSKYPEAGENRFILTNKKQDLKLELFFENGSLRGIVTGSGFTIASVPATYAVAAYKKRVVENP